VNRFSPISRVAATLLITLALWSAACNRDPNYAKQQYLKSGNKYYERGRYKEALIMYRKALAKDQKFGEAYYRMALTLEALGQGASLVGVLRRATELLPKGSKEWNDAALRLGEILVQGALSQNRSGKGKPLMDEAGQLQAVLDAKAPNSFEDLRLKAEVDRALAAQSLAVQDMPDFKKKLEDSIVDLRRSLAARPNDTATAIALARALSVDSQLAEAEQIYRHLIDRDKTLSTPYVELYRLYSAQRRTAEAEDILKRAIASKPKDFSFRTLLAAYYFSQKRPADMTRVLEDMETHFSDFPKAYLTAGDFYARIGNFDLAIQQYKAGEQKDAKNKLDYQKRQVEVQLRQGKKDDAYAETAEMIKEDPRDPDVRAMQANFLMDRGDVDKAITTLQEVITAKPDNFVARFNLGRAFAAKGENQLAMQQYRESLRLRPDFTRARIGLAETEIRNGDYEAALKLAQDTERLAPNNANARLLEAVALMRTGKVEDARKIFQDLIARNPKFSEAYLEYGSLSMAEKKYDAARESFAHAYESNPADLRGLFGEVETYLLTKQPDKALDLLQAEVNAHPQRADLLRGFANLKARMGRYDSALTDYDTLLNKFNENNREKAETYLEIGQLYAGRGDLTTGVTYLNKAKALEPASVPLLNLLAQIYERTGDNQDAQANYRAVLALDSNNAMALNNLAYSIANTGANLDEALTLATRAKQALPKEPRVSDTLGWIYLKKNMKTEASDIFRDLTAKAPDNPTYRYHYCIALSEKGDKAGARRECDAALAMHPDQREEKDIRQLMARLQ
jgi:tetratricopeptide (TPR) repeat protein